MRYDVNSIAIQHQGDSRCQIRLHGWVGVEGSTGDRRGMWVPAVGIAPMVNPNLTAASVILSFLVDFVFSLGN